MRKILLSLIALLAAHGALGVTATKAYVDRKDAEIRGIAEDANRKADVLQVLAIGTNVILEVTNYNSKTKSPEMRLLRLDEDGKYQISWTETNNHAKTLALAITNAADLVAAEKARSDAAYAPKGWSGVTSGLGAEAPKDTTWISTPQTVFGGGYEFAKYVTSSGGVWVLTAVTPQTVATNSTAFWGVQALDGTPAISVEKTDSVLVGVSADDITVANNIVTIPIKVVSAEHPLLRYTETLSPASWRKEEDGINGLEYTWSGESGNWICTIDGSKKSGFFYFEFWQEGSIKIKHQAVLDASAGILCTDGIHKVRPVYNNGVITWEAF